MRYFCSWIHIEVHGQSVIEKLYLIYAVLIVAHLVYMTSSLQVLRFVWKGGGDGIFFTRNEGENLNLSCQQTNVKRQKDL